MKRLKTLISFIMVGILLAGCAEKGAENISSTSKYPYIEYRNSSFNYDSYNRIIKVEAGYVLNEGHSYDVIETKDGYDLIIHFVLKDKK